jgi:hypothetical protein
MALNKGWNEHRRKTQVFFVLPTDAAMAVALFIAARRQRQFFPRHPLILSGGVFLAAFTFLRATIFNHVDEAVGVNLGEDEWIASLELIGIACFNIASVCAKNIRH